MFYSKQISPIGCLLWTIFLVWIFVALKLYIVVGILIIIALIYNFINNARRKYEIHQAEKEKNYEPEMGEVYKICPYCGKDVRRSAKICPHCNRPLE